MLAMVFRFSFRVCLKTKKRLLLVSGCFLFTVIVYLILDIAHVTRTENSQRKMRIQSYFQNASFKAKVELSDDKNAATSTDPQACIHPDLPLWGPDVRNYITEVENIVCNADDDWVYTENGNFYITSKAAQTHGDIRCNYFPILTGENDSYATGRPVANIQNGSKLMSDGFTVSCKANDGTAYKNIHVCISKTESKEKFQNTDRDSMNILIVGFDSVSRQMFKRLMPKTHEYFTKTLGGSILEGYNIVGDGTPQALMPMLTGKQETEIPEVRRGKPDARPLDEILTFIWKRFENKGYVTQWGEDMANIGTFNLRMLGFKKQPVHHYMRPFYLNAIPLFHHFKRFCLGSKPRHEVFFNWIKEGLLTNKGKKFFTFGFFSEYSHNNNNFLALADDDVLKFLTFLKNEKFLDNTVLVVMSDHGLRYGAVRTTEQGKLEERMPYFGFRFPKKFKSKFPRKIDAFLKNTERLVTPFDIHETLLELVGDIADNSENNKKRGLSLLHEIPRERTCEDAGIEPHWCACLHTTYISVSDFKVLAAVNTVLSLINSMMEPFQSLCHNLTLVKITKAITMETNDKVLKFKKSSDKDGRIADMSDVLSAKDVHYQITFETYPSGGLFEATAKVDAQTGLFRVNEHDISRLNKYGDDPYCILEKAPRLRPYCVCKT